MSDSVSILIPTFNGFLRVQNLLENLKQRTSKEIPYEIIVCDDSGKASHRDKVRSICKNYGAKFVYHESNRGVPTAWNTLVKASEGTHCILLNDDILVGTNWLKHPWFAMTHNPLIGSFGLHCYFITASDTQALLQGPEATVIPLNVRYEGGVLIRDQRFDKMPEEHCDPPGRTMCPSGCAFGFHKDIWRLVGGFDEDLFAFYEETSFGCACAYRGLPSIQLSYPANYHMWSQTFGSAPEIDAGRVINQSRKIFVDKWSKILNVKFNDAPDIHNLLMDKIPSIEVRWLDINHLERTSFA